MALQQQIECAADGKQTEEDEEKEFHRLAYVQGFVKGRTRVRR